MTLAAPYRAPDRARPFALLSAAAVAGFGLGLMGLALTAPVSDVAPLPPVTAQDTAPSGIRPDTADRAAWPPLFGSPRREAPAVEPTPAIQTEPEDDTGPMFDPETLVLRGVVVDDVGSIALIETPDGPVLARVGDTLADGAEIVTIEPEGIEVVIDDQLFPITFDETAQSPQGTDTFQEGPVDDPLPTPARRRERPFAEEAPADSGLRGMFGSRVPAYVPTPPQVGGPPPRGGAPGTTPGTMGASR
ncbi:MAG: hypothetical protein KDK22_04025 [Rhodobacteraceae bacterium]|nr:hypothetical protein [Paracoccaceae bacterium]